MSDTKQELREYDELDQAIIDCLTVDPRVQWSYDQRKAVRSLLTDTAKAEVNKALDKAIKIMKDNKDNTVAWDGRDQRNFIENLSAIEQVRKEINDAR